MLRMPVSALALMFVNWDGVSAASEQERGSAICIFS